MIDLKEQIYKTEQAYINALRAYALINEDGAVRVHKKFEKKFNRAMNTVFREMLSEIAASIKPNTRNKPNPEAHAILESVTIVQPQPQPTDLYSADDTQFTGRTFAPSPDDISTIQKEASMEEDLIASNPWNYMDMGESEVTPPMRSQLPNGQSNTQKRIIAPDGSRIEE